MLIRLVLLAALGLSSPLQIASADRLLDAERFLQKSGDQILDRPQFVEELQMHNSLLRALVSATTASPSQRDKASHLLSFAQLVQRQPDSIGPSGLPSPASVQRMTSAGASCKSAIPVSLGQAWSIPVTGQESVWLRVELPGPANLRLSTRGSDIDAALSVWTDCEQEAAVAQADDDFGLQAEIALLKSERSSWLVRLDNLSGTSGKANIAALGAAVFSGTIVRDENSQPAGGHRVGVFNFNSGNPQFLATAAADAQGIYFVAVDGPGTFVLRTGRTSITGLDVIDEAYDDYPCSNINLTILSACENYSPITLNAVESRIVDFRLVTGPVLNGQITSGPDGSPIESAEIEIYNTAGTYIRQAFSGAGGHYRIAGLSPGSIRMIVRASDHTAEVFDDIPCHLPCLLDNATPIQLVAQQETQIDFELQRSQMISLALTLDGKPLPPFLEGRATLFNVAGGPNRQFTFYSHILSIGPVAPGTYKLMLSSNFAYPQLYEDVECASNCLAELPAATPLVIAQGTSNIQVSMNLRSYAQMSGRITIDQSGEAIANASVSLTPAGNGNSVLHVMSDATGRYLFEYVRSGSYLLKIRSEEHIDEIYDNVPCEEHLNPGLGCPGGQLLHFGPQQEDRTLDVQLSPSGKISGRVAIPQSETSFVEFFFLDAAGSVLDMRSVFLDGGYELPDVQPGSYRLAAILNGRAQLYPNVECPSAINAVFTGCDFSSTEMVTVASDTAVTGIDFQFLRGHRTVQVISAETGQPLMGIGVDAWRSNGSQANAHVTDSEGFAYVLLSPEGSVGDVRISTRNNLGLIDEVYDGIACPFGSAHAGLCSLAGGTQLSMPAEPETLPIIISLSQEKVYADGFESTD